MIQHKHTHIYTYTYTSEMSFIEQESDWVWCSLIFSLSFTECWSWLTKLILCFISGSQSIIWKKLVMVKSTTLRSGMASRPGSIFYSLGLNKQSLTKLASPSPKWDNNNTGIYLIDSTWELSKKGGNVYKECKMGPDRIWRLSKHRC